MRKVWHTETCFLKCSKADISKLLGASQIESTPRSCKEETSRLETGSSYRKEWPKLHEACASDITQMGLQICSTEASHVHVWCYSHVLDLVLSETLKL